MASGTLRGTQYEDDAQAIDWFVRVFMYSAGGELDPELCAELLSSEECRKWREIEPPTVVKDWILELLEHCPEDMRDMDL